MGSPRRWRTSSFSSNGTSCVEVFHTLGAVRDSKNPEGPILRVDFGQLLAVLRRG
jgi:hypothetical protein